MAITRTTQGTVTVLAVAGAFTGGDETTRLREAIIEEGARGNIQLVIDFSACPMMDSSGIAVLVEAYRNYTKRGGRIRLCALQARLANQFAIVRLFELLPRHETRAEAISAFETAT